ncbi:hypothetical protein Mame01_14670 [Microbispora amethystogenes]|nr:hypothetical protein Mame01_14670 [Microbispora amethystogenes]
MTSVKADVRQIGDRPLRGGHEESVDPFDIIGPERRLVNGHILSPGPETTGRRDDEFPPLG